MRYFPPLALFQSVFASNEHLLKKKLPALCSLAVDTGQKYFGFSVSDTDLTCSSPIWTYVLGENEAPEVFGRFMEQLIRNENVGGMLVGYSAVVNKSKRAAHEAQITNFLDRVFESGYLRGFPFTLADETGSSNDAHHFLRFIQNVVSPDEYKLLHDQNAAWHFHELWLLQVNSGRLYSSPSSKKRQKKMEFFGKQWNRTHWG